MHMACCGSGGVQRLHQTLQLAAEAGVVQRGVDTDHVAGLRAGEPRIEQRLEHRQILGLRDFRRTGPVSEAFQDSWHRRDQVDDHPRRGLETAQVQVQPPAGFQLDIGKVLLMVEEPGEPVKIQIQTAVDHPVAEAVMQIRLLFGAEEQIVDLIGERKSTGILNAGALERTFGVLLGGKRQPKPICEQTGERGLSDTAVADDCDHRFACGLCGPARFTLGAGRPVRKIRGQLDDTPLAVFGKGGAEAGGGGI